MIFLNQDLNVRENWSYKEEGMNRKIKFYSNYGMASRVILRYSFIIFLTFVFICGYLNEKNILSGSISGPLIGMGFLLWILLLILALYFYEYIELFNSHLIYHQNIWTTEKVFFQNVILSIGKVLILK